MRNRVVSKLASISALLVAAAILSACTTTASVKPEYVSAGLAAPLVQGHATLVMDSAAQTQIITASPTSMTGAATTLAEPVGAIIKMAGEKVLGAGFATGASTSTQPKAGDYNIAVRLDQYSYMFDQLSNLGFAITPKVTVSLKAVVTDPVEKPLTEKVYTRTDYTAGAYVASLQPQEKINQALHMAVAEIFREMMDDIAKASDKKPE
jgi:uncharacterized lipoprotein YajG